MPPKKANTEANTQESQKPSFAENLAEKIIAELEKGTAPWQKPWMNAERAFNPITGNTYKGANRMRLMLSGYNDPRYMTFNQAKEAGYSIKKGSKGIPLQTYIFEKESIKKDNDGKAIKDENGEYLKEKVKLLSPIISQFTVFNAEQIEGIPPYERLAEKMWETDEVAEEILTNSDANITHRYGNSAYYNAEADEIVLPEKNQFPTKQDYYATALHELSHWTGHESRLNRLNITERFGSEPYAKEELRAEIASMLLGQDLGITHDTSRHISYVDSWIKVIKESPNELVKACNEAEKISTYLLSFAPERVQEQLNKRQLVQNTTSIDTNQHDIKGNRPVLPTELEMTL